MTKIKTSALLVAILTLGTGHQTFAQLVLALDLLRDSVQNDERFDRAKEVRQDNEYTPTGYEEGIFYDNPLRLDGEPLDYSEFGFLSKGQLTVVKGAATTGDTTQVPFMIYLKRNGNNVIIPGGEKTLPSQMSVEISDILKHAKPGDQIVIHPFRKEDGLAKRILKLLGC